MATLGETKLELERLAERRARLLHALGEKHDAAVAAEHATLEREIGRLWEQFRLQRAQTLFGARTEIVARARRDERTESGRNSTR